MNTVTLDDGMVIRKSSGGGGGIPINNQSKSVEFIENGTSEVRYDVGYTGLEKVSIKVAIPNEEKTIEITENGTTEVVADKGFLNKVIVNTYVASGGGDTPSRPSWTGHADAEGLKAIGWTDEDIAYYQANGVNWNAEDDEYHKVSAYDKEAYANNKSLKKDNSVEYFFKREISGYPQKIHESCPRAVACPSQTITASSLPYVFQNCSNLRSVGVLDCSSVTEMNSTFSTCYNIKSIVLRNTENVTTFNNAFNSCTSLEKVELNVSSKCTDLYAFMTCRSLVEVKGEIDFLSVTIASFLNCIALERIQIKNLGINLSLSSSPRFSKESLLYIISNEAATSAITITLHASAYSRFATDQDIVAALNNHPNISLASA